MRTRAAIPPAHRQSGAAIGETLDQRQPGETDAAAVIDAHDFEVGFGEKSQRLTSIGGTMAATGRPSSINSMRRSAGRCSRRTRYASRCAGYCFPSSRPARVPQEAGVFKVTRQQLEATQRNVLLQRRCGGVRTHCSVHDTLPLTITQIGVCLVSYQGEQGAVGPSAIPQRLTMRGQTADGALESLQRRQLASGRQKGASATSFSELGRSRIMSYAERARLCGKAKRRGAWATAIRRLMNCHWLWSMELLQRSLTLLRKLISTTAGSCSSPAPPASGCCFTIGTPCVP